MTYLYEFFVHKLDASKTGRFKKLDLRFDEKVKCYLRYEEARSRARRVPYSGTYILVIQIVCRVNRRQSVSEHVVEDVVYSRAAGELFCADFDVCAFD